MSARHPQRPTPMSGDSDGFDEGATTVLGLRSRTAAVMTAVFLLIAAVVTVASRACQDTAYGPPMASLALLVIGMVVVALAPGDPLPGRWTAIVAVIPAPQVAVMWSVLPTHPSPDPMLLAPTIGGAAVVCTILAVRGRVVVAWAAQVASGAVFGAWTADSGIPVDLLVGLYLSNIGIMLVATYFVWVMRPAVSTIFRLRALVTSSAAAVAAAEGARHERDAQTARIDRIARPLLTRIADGDGLTEDEVARAALVEASLRESIRARVLDVPAVVEAVWDARRRGVTVQLFDDVGLDPEVAGLTRPQCEDVLTRLTGAIVETLRSMDSGSVTVRVQPPGRETSAVIIRTVGEDVTRVEFDRPAA